jgi:hypothetical protein
MEEGVLTWGGVATSTTWGSARAAAEKEGLKKVGTEPRVMPDMESRGHGTGMAIEGRRGEAELPLQIGRGKLGGHVQDGANSPEDRDAEIVILGVVDRGGIQGGGINDLLYTEAKGGHDHVWAGRAHLAERPKAIQIAMKFDVIQGSQLASFKTVEGPRVEGVGTDPQVGEGTMAPVEGDGADVEGTRSYLL